MISGGVYWEKYQFLLMLRHQNFLQFKFGKYLRGKTFDFGTFGDQVLNISLDFETQTSFKFDFGEFLKGKICHFRQF